MKEEISEYEQQAQDFLKSVGATIETKFKKHGLHFEDDKEERDIYLITIKKGDRSYTFDFGNSISDSSFKLINTNTKGEIKYLWFEDLFKELYKLPRAEQPQYFKKYVLDKIHSLGCEKIINPKEPTAYDILSCLSVFEGDFKDFCLDFGYDEDSRKAYKFFKKVQEESNNLKMLFTDAELQRLSDIA